MNLKLTKAERSILINQFLMLKLIDKQDSTSHYRVEDYDNFISILHNGYEGFYDEFLPRDILPKEVSDEVLDIIYMYDRATISYENLSDDEKENIDKYDITFRGFDGNEEIEHYGIYKFIIEDLQKFGHMFKDEHLNSHSSKLEKYRHQLELFEKYKLSGDVLDLEGLNKVFG